MTVTLDNVLLLLYLHIMGKFCEIEPLEFEEVQFVIIDLLGVDRTRAEAKMTQACGPKVR